MSTNPANEDVPNCKLNNDNQPIVVASDIENVVLVAYIVSRKKINLYIRQIFHSAFSVISYQRSKAMRESS